MARKRMDRTKKFNGRRYELIVSSRKAPDGVFTPALGKKVAKEFRSMGANVRTLKVGNSGRVRVYYSFK